MDSQANRSVLLKLDRWTPLTSKSVLIAHDGGWEEKKTTPQQKRLERLSLKLIRGGGGGRSVSYYNTNELGIRSI